MSQRSATPLKPKALRRGSKLAVFSPSSPAERLHLFAGIAELRRLGFDVYAPPASEPQEYFAAPQDHRIREFVTAMQDDDIAGVVAARGGYGANYLLEADLHTLLRQPKCVVGFSDLTSLQVYLWQLCGWVTFHAPMVGAGLNDGAEDSRGYDEPSFLRGLGSTQGGWEIDLRGEVLANGAAEGRLLGGCLTLLQTTLGTPWELDTSGAILVLEDRGMRPYQVDRALMHLKQAGKFSAVRGILLGEFPGCDPSQQGSSGVREVCERILAPLGVPVVYGAPVGHTKRAMLTLPLGIRAKLLATGQGTLEFLEPAVQE